MTVIPRDQTRDRRIEDPTNRWLVHPLAHALLPWAIRSGVSANAVSIIGLGLGLIAALCFARFHVPGFATLGLLFAALWLVADGLDGMIARATGTASPLGRALDGLCDHGVFFIIYVSVALAISTPMGWVLAVAAGCAHAVQSNLYEAERTRFHRRLRGDPGEVAPDRTRLPLERLYDFVTALSDRSAARFDRALAASPDRLAAGRRYAEAAIPAMRLLALETANARIMLLWLACMGGAPTLFFWAELGPLTLIAVTGILLHRRAEAAAIDQELA
ncbi:MAG: CDP-alcohol phosphatidyltransferase family protein [Pseudomonadota bacterium]